MTPTVPRNINTATTTVVKDTPGILRGISVNTTAAGTVTVYDNTSATGTKIGTLALSVSPGMYMTLPARFLTGLTIVTAGASDLTVYYE